MNDNLKLQTQIEDVLLSAKNNLKEENFLDCTESCLMPHLEKISLLKQHIMERLNKSNVDLQLVNNVSKIV